MEELFFFVLSFVFFVLVGGLVGLAVLLPRLRKLAREKPAWRIGLATGLSAFALLGSFIIWSLPDFDSVVVLPNLLRGFTAGFACAWTVGRLTRSS